MNEYINFRNNYSMLDTDSFLLSIRRILSDIDKQRTLIYRYDEIISIDEIKKIINYYKISKRNLSLLLGWGEITITRYLNGVVPTLPKSKLLKEIFYSPKYYYVLLFLNQHRISVKAFLKSEMATQKLLIKEIKNCNETM